MSTAPLPINSMSTTSLRKPSDSFLRCSSSFLLPILTRAILETTAAAHAVQNAAFLTNVFPTPAPIHVAKAVVFFFITRVDAAIAPVSACVALM